MECIGLAQVSHQPIAQIYIKIFDERDIAQYYHYLHLLDTNNPVSDLRLLHLHLNKADLYSVKSIQNKRSLRRMRFTLFSSQVKGKKNPTSSNFAILSPNFELSYLYILLFHCNLHRTHQNHHIHRRTQNFHLFLLFPVYFFKLCRYIIRFRTFELSTSK